MTGLVVLDDGKRKVVTGVGTTLDTGPQLDAFGRLRVSEPQNVFEYQFRYDTDLEYYWDEELVTGGTSAQTTNTVSRELSVTSTINSEAKLQSRRYIEYTEGKSQEILLTFNFNSGVPRVRKLLGFGDNENGIFLGLNGTIPQIVLRSKITGSVVDDAINQSSWNGDTLDGNGDSGVTLDFSKQQLISIDFAYLGIGDVRLFFIVGGKKILAHTFSQSNIETASWSQSGTLPIHYHIKNTGGGSATSMEVTCVAVVREGRTADIGKIRNGNTGTSAINFNGNETFIFGLRIKADYKYSSIRVFKFNILPRSGSDQAIWRIYYKPTLTGATYSDVPNSIAQFINNTPTFSGGLLVSSGYINLDKKDSLSEDAIAQTDIFIGKDIAGVSDNLILTLETISGSGSANFSGNWKEII